MPGAFSVYCRMDSMDETELVKALREQIPDDAPVFGENEDEYMFSDETLKRFLTRANSSILRAAGLACLAIANSEALISKVIRTQDLQTNGPAVSDALNKTAAKYFELADKEDAVTNSAYFEIVDFPYSGRRAELTESF